MRNVVRIFSALVIVEALSLITFLYPQCAAPFFAAGVLGAAVLAFLYPLDFLCITFTELMVGGFGYLFSLHLQGFNVSVRLALYVIACITALYHGIKNHTIYKVAESSLWGVWMWFAFFIALGALRGIMRGYSAHNIFFDVNAYFFLAYLWVWMTLVQTRADVQKLKPYATAAVLYVACKTALVYFVFTHNVPLNVPLVYKWIRDTGVGELTPAANGFYRVFFQSHVYLLIAWIYVMIALIKEKFSMRRIIFLIISALCMASLVMSLSRSFMAALLTSAAVLLCVELFFWRCTIQETVRSGGYMCASAVGGVLIVLAVSFWPVPARHPFSLTDVWGARFNVYDSSASSRWAEAGPLWDAVKRNWIMGAGFGKTVTYISNDPRVRTENPSGEYTTTAFEWGYLDIWLKIGLLGLLTYLVIIKKLFSILLKSAQSYMIQGDGENALMPATLAFSLLALLIIHIFTPYLNHPLGFGVVILSAVWADSAYPFKNSSTASGLPPSA